MRKLLLCVAVDRENILQWRSQAVALRFAGISVMQIAYTWNPIERLIAASPAS